MQKNINDLVVFLIIVSALVLALGAFIVMMLYLYRKKQVLFLQNLEQIKLDYEKNRLAAQLEMQEQTFQNISREIHDNISLSLTLAKLHLNTLNWNEIAHSQTQVHASIELVSQSINDLSDISKSLNSDIINHQGLITALRNEVRRIEETGLFTIDFKMGGDTVYLDNQKELITFRIVQEAFNNIIKHAGASHAELTVCYNSDSLHITIRDNGKGFIITEGTPPEEAGKAGLSNMRTRTKMIGGTMEIKSTINEGSILSFIIPFSDNGKEQ